MAIVKLITIASSICGHTTNRQSLAKAAGGETFAQALARSKCSKRELSSGSALKSNSLRTWTRHHHKDGTLLRSLKRLLKNTPLPARLIQTAPDQTLDRCAQNTTGTLPKTVRTSQMESAATTGLLQCAQVNNLPSKTTTMIALDGPTSNN